MIMQGDKGKRIVVERESHIWRYKITHTPTISAIHEITTLMKYDTRQISIIIHDTIFHLHSHKYANKYGSKSAFNLPRTLIRQIRSSNALYPPHSQVLGRSLHPGPELELENLCKQVVAERVF